MRNARIAIMGAALALAAACDREKTGSTESGAKDSAVDADPAPTPDAGTTADAEAPIPDAAMPDAAADAEPVCSCEGADDCCCGADCPWGRPAPWDGVDNLPLAGEAAPWARVNYLDMPRDAEHAELRGCDVVGVHRGSGLGALVGLAGGVGLSEFVQPNENGHIALLLLARAGGWQAGQHAGDLDRIRFGFFRGLQSEAEAGLLVDPASFVPGTMTPSVAVDVDVRPTGEASSATTPFPLSWALPEGPPLTLSTARFAGELYTDGYGFGLVNGALTGYVTRQPLLDVTTWILATCAEPEAAEWCEFAAALFPPGSTPDVALDQLLDVIGGFDAKVVDGTVTTCEPGMDECNAVSLCLLVEMQGEMPESIAP
jgi:hypothetical protein